MASKVEICNMALLRLGQDNIMSVEDYSPNARACAAEYTPALEATLRSYFWPFAMRHAELAMEESPVREGWNYFKLPASCVRVKEVGVQRVRWRSVWDRGQGPFYWEPMRYDLSYYTAPYTIEGQSILSPSRRIAISYVTRDIIEAEMDPICAEAIACRLASVLAIRVLENPQMKDIYYNEWQILIRQAKSISASEKYPQRVMEGNWIWSRA